MRRPVQDRRPSPIDGLFDLKLVVAPDGGLASPERPTTSLTADELAELVCRDGGQGEDVRIVAPIREQNLFALAALAGLLERDVLIAPPGARLTYGPSFTRALALGPEVEDDDEICPVDIATGDPLDWWTIPPSGEIGSVATWFDTVGGRVRPRAGVVGLPLAGAGIMFATRQDFVVRRTAAAGLRPGHPGIVTVAIGVASGAFQLGDYSGRSTDCDGTQLAAALATLPLYGMDVRMWLSWPEPAAQRLKLARALTDLAEVTGATVWAPAEGSRAELRGGCRDISAVGAGGEPASWQPYGLVDEARFESDVDGRLVPIGGVAVTQLTPRPDAFVADLGVLDDGRLALRYADGSMLAAGGRQLRELLRQAGWRDAPIVLLSKVAPEQADRAHRHAAVLSREIGATITFDVANVEVPPAAPVTVHSRPTRSRGRHASEEEDDDAPGLAPPVLSSRLFDGPRLVPADRSSPPHRISWLPRAPQTNSEEFDVYLECFDDPDEATTYGVASPHLFLLGHLDHSRLAARTAAENLLHVRVGAGGAIDVSASEVTVPHPFAKLLRHSDVYLLPAAWLSECGIASVFRLTGAGTPVVQRFPETRPLLLRCAGAGHGVPGLPADSVPWPGSLRPAVTCFALAPDGGLGTWLRLFQGRPQPKDGQRLLELRIARRTAIDVVATANEVAALASVRSVAGELVTHGVEYILPTASYASTVLLREYHFHSGHWRRTPGTGNVTLDDWSPVPLP